MGQQSHCAGFLVRPPWNPQCVRYVAGQWVEECDEQIIARDAVDRGVMDLGVQGLRPPASPWIRYISHRGACAVQWPLV